MADVIRFPVERIRKSEMQAIRDMARQHRENLHSAVRLVQTLQQRARLKQSALRAVKQYGHHLPPEGRARAARRAVEAINRGCTLNEALHTALGTDFPAPHDDPGAA